MRELNTYTKSWIFTRLRWGIRIFKEEVSEKKLTIRKYLGMDTKLNKNSMKGYIVNLRHGKKTST